MKLSWSPKGRVAARRVGLLGEAKTLVLVVSLLERRGRDNDKSDGADFSGDSGRGYAQRKLAQLNGNKRNSGTAGTQGTLGAIWLHGYSMAVYGCTWLYGYGTVSLYMATLLYGYMPVLLYG